VTRDISDAARIAAAIGPLRLVRARARRGRHAGSHPRRLAGAGTEFWQYRTLEAGEPADKVDWRRSARSDELYVRERERQDPVRLWLWVDGSASMDFASEGAPTKAAYARTIAAALGLAAHEASETCCVLPAPRPLAPLAMFEALGAGGGTPALPALGPSDIIVAAGDFLDDGGLDWVMNAASQGASGVIVAVQDRAEIAFPFAGRVRFEAVEADEAAHEVGRAEDLTGRYADAWAAHRARLANAGANPSWLLVEAATDTRVDAAAARIASWLGSSG